MKHGLSKTPEYKAWAGMKSRCLNPNATGYENYGGRGITIHEKWINNFPEFLKYVGQKPSSFHVIDRINNNGNYEPGNIRWATKNQSLGNTRNSNYRESFVLYGPGPYDIDKICSFCNELGHTRKSCKDLKKSLIKSTRIL